MADQYSNQYQSAYVDKPSGKLKPHELNGRVRRIYADITISAEIAVTDIVKICKLPANAVIIEARLIAAAGTSGTLELGWGAGENSEVADPNGIMAGMNVAAAIDDTMAWTDAGFNKRFAEEVDVELSASVVTVGFSGNTVQVELRYIID